MLWWVDASFAVHPDMKSHTGMCVSLGRGCLYSRSTKQKINTKSSTEAELVGTHDCLPINVWFLYFLRAQGYKINANTIYQDNQSAMKLERNGKASSGRATRHMHIRYFFITGKVKQKELTIEYCPTDQMLADIHTKPLQGSKFYNFRKQLLNLTDTQHKSVTPTIAALPTADKENCSSQASIVQECVGTDGVRVNNTRRRPSTASSARPAHPLTQQQSNQAKTKKSSLL